MCANRIERRALGDREASLRSGKVRERSRVRVAEASVSGVAIGGQDADAGGGLWLVCVGSAMRAGDGKRGVCVANNVRFVYCVLSG